MDGKAVAHVSPFALYLGLSAFTLLAWMLFLGVPAASAARSSSSKIAVKNCTENFLALLVRLPYDGPARAYYRRIVDDVGAIA